MNILDRQVGVDVQLLESTYIIINLRKKQ